MRTGFYYGLGKGGRVANSSRFADETSLASASPPRGVSGTPNIRELVINNVGRGELWRWIGAEGRGMGCTEAQWVPLTHDSPPPRL